MPESVGFEHTSHIGKYSTYRKMTEIKYVARFFVGFLCHLRMKGPLGMGPLSLKRLRGGELGGGEGAPSLGTLEDMFRECPDMGISLHRGPYSTEGTCVWGREALIPGTLKDGCKRAPYWGTLRYVKQRSEMGVYFHRAPLWGKMGGSFFLGAFLLQEFSLGSKGYSNAL